MATVQDHLENTPEKIQDLFLDLQERILDLGDDIEEGPTSQYISYKRSGEGIFSYIRIQKKAVKIQLTIPRDNLNDTKGISVGVSNKAFKSVKTEIKLEEIDDLEYVFDLVQQCYQSEERGKFDYTELNEDFPWTRFYEAFAKKLLEFKNKRKELTKRINQILKQTGFSHSYREKYENGTSGPLEDICPFTIIGIFNRGIKPAKKIRIATELAKFLKITEPVPDSFHAIPTLYNKDSWFFRFEKDREPEEIDILWEIFEKAIELSSSKDKENRQPFITAYNKAAQRSGLGWKLTIGLYWIAPWNFPTLESKSRAYIKKLGIEIGGYSPNKYPNAKDYLEILDALEKKFHDKTSPVHSFPELSMAAFNEPETTDPVSPPENGYSMDNLIGECFIDRPRLERILHHLETKKNLILQGPPGTGKTWLAKRLAFVLVGREDNSQVKALQFHPNLSYEDFVRGWRPAGDGKLELVNGPFLQIAEAARKDPTEKYVIVIEEINRGNPAQILGELLTLLEADKRNADEALELCYSNKDGERFFIPENLYVIGTMNIADRSLALVDLALRRRFTFVNLEPVFGEPWKKWVHDKFDIDRKILSEIENRIRSLNDIISKDQELGPQFCIGHSYVTPTNGTSIKDARDWFQQVVNTEIGPLLDEYWFGFDNLNTAKEAKQALLQGF